MKHDDAYHKATLAPIGKVLYYGKFARFYKNGDGSSFIWNYWNPLSWPVILLAVIASILITGIPETFAYPHEIGLVINPYFAEFNEKVEFF